MRKRYFEYKDYIGSIHYSRKDKYYHGKVLGLDKTVLSYKGNTILDLEADFKSVIDKYIEDCKQNSNEPYKAPYRIIINVTEFMKHLGMYLDLAGIREIIITRFQGEKMEFYELRPVDIENIEDEDLYKSLVESQPEGLQVISGKEKANFEDLLK